LTAVQIFKINAFDQTQLIFILLLIYTGFNC